MLEQQFYLNIHQATPKDYFRIANALSHIMKGGTPQMWRLLSREITHAYRDGHLNEADLELLVETRM